MAKRVPRGLLKCPTGIRGLDEITGGGLPRDRPILVCGGPGCGKTLLAMEFLVRGAVEYGEHGVFIAFEETAEELARNVASLGQDVRSLIAQKVLFIDHVQIDPDNQEAGDYNLEGLFVRLKHAVDVVKAKRIVLDTIENLFSGFGNASIVRVELRRLFRWLKENHLTAVITAEGGDGTLTRQGIEEYVSDCVIRLDHRVSEQLATRRLRVVKYRGSKHGTDEYPFLIDDHGIAVVPVTSLELNRAAPTTFVSSGVPQLDSMLGGKGYYTGSTVLVSGGAGTGKTSLAAAFIDRACRGGTRAIYFSFEESMQQIVRDMNSINFDLKKWVDRGLLRFYCSRPAVRGLELHMAAIHAAVMEFDPKVVVIDPITDLSSTGAGRDVHTMLTRLMDFLKGHGLTTLLTGLGLENEATESAAGGISSLIDTWIELRDMEFGDERNRAVFVCKSRGMAHSDQVREFIISSKGIRLVDVCVGPEGVLTGSARVAHQTRLRRASTARQRQAEALRKQLQSRKEVARARIAALNAELAAEVYGMESTFATESQDQSRDRDERSVMAGIRSNKGRKAMARG